MQKRIVQTTLVVLLVLITGVFRFVGIGQKPLHHDESLFAYYGYQVGVKGYYEAGGYAERYGADALVDHKLPTHHPLLHGPFLMQTLGGLLHFTHWAGVESHHEDAIIRWPSAMAMLLLIPLIFAFGKYLCLSAKWFAVLLFSASPTFWYYSRFCRNDLIFACATMLTVLAWTHALSGLSRRHKTCDRLSSNDLWLLLALFSTALTIAIKENAVFLIFNAVTFGVLYLVMRFKSAVNLPHVAFSNGKVYTWVAGVALGLLLLELVYTNGFMWNTSFAQMYSDAVHYWSGQNKEHRLYGEFHYYLLRLLLYEPIGVFIVLSVALAFILKFFKKTLAQIIFIVGFALMLFAFMLGSFFFGVDDLTGEQFLLGRMLHMTQPWHLAMSAAVAWSTLCAAVFLILKHRVFGAWLCWWAGFSFLEYNYAGEKVPWIGVHIVLPMLMMSGYILGLTWQRLAMHNHPRVWRIALSACFGLYIVLNFAQGYRLCFRNDTSAAELLVYNHTQYAFRDLALEMRTLALEFPEPAMPSVMMQGEGVWPMQWYLRGTNHVFADEQYFPPHIGDIQILICNDSYRQSYPELENIFVFEDLSFRRHWFPDTLHLFTPLHRAITDMDGQIKAREAWSMADQNYADSIRWQYGKGAWKSLIRYIIYRQMWGKPDYLAIPMTIPAGRQKAK